MTERNRIVIIGDLSKARVTRITTRQKGSWKWQDRFGLSTYAAKRTRDGEIIWKCVKRNSSRCDFSINHAPSEYRFGGLNNQPLGMAFQDEIKMKA